MVFCYYQLAENSILLGVLNRKQCFELRKAVLECTLRFFLSENNVPRGGISICVNTRLGDVFLLKVPVWLPTLLYKWKINLADHYFGECGHITYIAGTCKFRYFDHTSSLSCIS